jgi:hypothetical protein
MKQLKRHQVHGLPTEESLICKTNGKLYYYPQENWFTRSTDTNPQHLYITTDEEIKEGDWYLATIFGHGTEEVKPLQWSVGTKPCGEQPMGRKIIASTDPKLFKDGDAGIIDHAFKEGMLNIPQSFIEEYCKSGGIDEVLVEMECPQCQDWGYVSECRKECNQKFIQLKVDPIHNTITTHLIVEKMYSIEDLYMSASFVVKLIAANRGNSEWNMKTTPKMIIDQWIKENL